jgi:hypothetical protein
VHTIRPDHEVVSLLAAVAHGDLDTTGMLLQVVMATALDTLLVSLMRSEDERLPPQALGQLMRVAGYAEQQTSEAFREARSKGYTTSNDFSRDRLSQKGPEVASR